jgi:hypothetical protein
MQRRLKNISIVILTILAFWFIKFYLMFPSLDIEIIGIILTISSILFGFLAGFFISELWTRYTEIRSLQGTRAAHANSMVKYATHFFRNKRFEKDFKLKVEKSAIADGVIKWNEGHLELPYYYNIADSFETHIKVRDKKDEVYMESLLESYNDFVDTTVTMDALYKDRLFLSEWIILGVLSLIISVSLLFLDISHIFYQAVVIVFPAIITLSISFMYGLDRLIWNREMLTIEPNQRILEAIGARRFYLKSDLKFVSPHIKDYRTEDDLSGELKQAYQDVLRHRELERQR